ncbi:unnamed protein product [Trichogramma brassicae]|uniref:Rad21/Rec8-like protein N-terminal domain-containing protein n=1 Tax=Trichogramma brassicae TaxID=86971 RepID=A0A6H5I0Z5_9HYME|nr:unnamed protein product [Trichogramma brassicae]
MFYPTTLLRRSKRGCLQKCRIAALSKTFMGQGAFKLKKVDIFKAEIEDCCDEIIVGVSEQVGENSLWEASLSMFGLTRIFDKKMDFILADVKILYGELTTLAKPSKSKKKDAMMNAQEIYAPPSTSMLVESSQQASVSSENDSQSSTDNRRKRSKKGEEVCDNVKQIVLKNLGTSAFTREYEFDQ